MRIACSLSGSPSTHEAHVRDGPGQALLHILGLLQAPRVGLDMALEDLKNVFAAADIDNSTKARSWRT
jgi:hypothetical protein